MSRKNIENIIREFSKTGSKELSDTFEYKGEVYHVNITKGSGVVTERFNVNKAHTISALPSGSPCGCCGGTGRSS